MITSDKDVATPWHDGELAAQERVGVIGRMARIGPHVIRSFMPDQHRLFFATLPFIVVGSVDQSGSLWASILSGAPGFARSPDPDMLHIGAKPCAGDPLGDGLALDMPLGLLGIELSTRRRNRMNGRVAAMDETGFIVAVDQSFGNCPQYIQRRDYTDGIAPPMEKARVEPFRELDEGARKLIECADTCFVASSAGGGSAVNQGVDVSHRGGRTGFIGIASDGAIVIPDYAGNLFFNTLGNLLVNPRAGLLFVDFGSGDLLQVTGTSDIIWEGEEVRAFEGAERLWRLKVSHGQWLRGALPFRLALREFSPKLTGTGTWHDAQRALDLRQQS